MGSKRYIMSSGSICTKHGLESHRVAGTDITTCPLALASEFLEKGLSGSTF